MSTKGSIMSRPFPIESCRRIRSSHDQPWMLQTATLMFLLLLFLSSQPRVQSFHMSPLSQPKLSSTALFGIPKMFRWLTDQYPNINRKLSEGLHDDKIVDAFYLDMNGIIHPCTHGNNQDEIVVLDETAMFKKIFGYVDRLYKIVRPRRLLYLAVDGVAPRAKMNQQRSRRFRSSREAEELAATILARDGALPDASSRFDSNCITPGTDFMLKLGLAMTKWIEFKQKSDPFWINGADVVFTGPDVPGEGEHKVMEYIRAQKEYFHSDRSKGLFPDDAIILVESKEGRDPDSSTLTQTPHLHWEPNLTHVLYGLDADLIMLGLVTHEPNFMLLREKMSVVMAGRGRNKDRKKKDMLEYTRDDFDLLELQMLRQMFQIQFRKFADRESFDARYDPSRIIDDFVFMCMLVGNDFLPHCPHLDIDNGSLSLMLNTYIDLLPEWKGYLTDKEKINPQRFEQFLYHIAAYEEEHFKRRGYEENEPGWQLSSENEMEDDDFYGTWYGGKPTPASALIANKKLKYPRAISTDTGLKGVHSHSSSNQDSSHRPLSTAEKGSSKTTKKFKNVHPSSDSRSYRDYYYETKLGWSPSKERRDKTLQLRRSHVRDYLEGLHWVLHYYHKGPPSWEWYFPHLYAPLCTDMVNLHEFYEDEDDLGEFKTFKFEQSEPFPSLAQLLSVLPPQSAGLLPKPLGELMVHPSSPIAEFYPREFSTDANGKRQSWEAVVKIPFIDGDILLDVVNSIIKRDKEGVMDVLTAAEKRRNVRGEPKLFVPPRENVGEETVPRLSFDGASPNRQSPTQRKTFRKSKST